MDGENRVEVVGDRGMMRELGIKYFLTCETLVARRQRSSVRVAGRGVVYKRDQEPRRGLGG